MYVIPHISDYIVIHVIVKGYVFEFIGLGRTKNRIVLCEWCLDWFEFVAIEKNLITHENVMNKVQWEGIKICVVFGGTRILSQGIGSL